MMQLERYRKVSCQIWLDQKFLSLSDDGKLVFMLILTHPNLTSFGAMKASPASLTDELGWLTERLSEAFQEVLAKGLVHYDTSARLLVLPNFIKHNKPASPNVVTSWLGGYKELPECALKDELFHVLKGYAEAMSEAFQEAFRKAFGEASRKAVGIQRAVNREQKAVSKSKAGAAPDGASPKKPSSQGSRIPADWQPDEVLLAWAKAERPDLNLAQTVDSFRDYWIGKSGKDATKTDWPATFRNWVRREKQTPVPVKPQSPRVQL